jgi:hypothetical protein
MIIWLIVINITLWFYLFLPRRAVMPFKPCKILSVGWLDGAWRQKQKTEVWSTLQTLSHQSCRSLTAKQMIDTNVQNVPSRPKRNARVGAFQYKWLYSKKNGLWYIHIKNVLDRLQRVTTIYKRYQCIPDTTSKGCCNVVVVHIDTLLLCVPLSYSGTNTNTRRYEPFSSPFPKRTVARAVC